MHPVKKLRSVSVWTLVTVGLACGTAVLVCGEAQAGSGPTAAAVSPAKFLSETEREWLAAHPVIRFAPDQSWPPIDFVRADGRHAGIAADYLKLVEERLGVRFVQVYSPAWDETMTKLSSREIDFVATCVLTPERQERMLFTSAFLRLRNVIIVPNAAPERVKLRELEGRRIAVVAGHAIRDYVATQLPTATIKLVPDFRTGLREVSFGNADAMVGDIASASYLIQQDGITNLRIGGRVGYDYPLRFASRNDWPELNQILEKALATITPEERQAIYSQWVRLEHSSLLTSQVFWVWSAVAVLMAGLVLAGIVFWNRALKRQVRLRTEQLSNELAERRRAEQERRRLEEDLRQAQKMEVLGTLAAGVAHDFNNLLTVISGFTGTARLTLPPDHPAQEHLGLVETAVKDACGITRSLLTLSRKAASIKAPVDIGKVVKDSLRLLKCILPGGCELEVIARNEEPLFVNADVGQLHQVLLNLVTNARDAMAGGGCIRVCVSGSAETAGPAGRVSQSAILVVSDTGEGMSPEVLNHVFDPFFTTKSPGQGTGLGLAITHAIIGEHEGTIELDSKAGEGTRVIIRLPLCEPPVDIATAGTREQATRGRPCSVLLADDSPPVRTILLRTLERSGCAVVEVGSGDEAFSILSRRLASFDLAVLDFDLPGMDGLEIARRVQLERPEFPIVIVSGNPELQMAETAHLRRLAKPFAMGELVALISQLVGAGSRGALASEPLEADSA